MVCILAIKILTIVRKITLSLLTICSLSYSSRAQSIIRGEVKSLETNKMLDSVIVKNIYNDNEGIICDDMGRFEIEVKSGELIEFSRPGFDVLHVRIVNEKQPTFYVLHLEKKKPLLDVRGNLLAYQLDSLDYDRTFYNSIHGTKQGDNNAQAGSLDALSKQNRERWAFQKMQEKWQNEKYVDFVFNEELVKRITYLDNEDLKRFMRIYRPNYRFLRESTEYEYLKYIKDAYKLYRKQEKY